MEQDWKRLWDREGKMKSVEKENTPKDMVMTNDCVT